MRSSSLVGVFLCLVVLSTVPCPSAAQIEVHTRLSAQLGLVSPQGPLYVWESPGGDDWYLSRSETDLGHFPTVGLSLDVGDPRLGFCIKARVNRSVGLRADFTGLGFYERHPEFGSPDAMCLYVRPPDGGVLDRNLDRFEWQLDASITEFGVDLVLPTRLGIGPIEPFVVAGLGARHYQFNLSDQSGWLSFFPPRDGTRWSFRVGGGLDFRLMGRTYCLSVIDAMSEYPVDAWNEDPKGFRHHVFWELGIPVATRVLFTP